MSWTRRSSCATTSGLRCAPDHQHTGTAPTQATYSSRYGIAGTLGYRLAVSTIMHGHVCRCWRVIPRRMYASTNPPWRRLPGVLRRGALVVPMLATCLKGVKWSPVAGSTP